MVFKYIFSKIFRSNGRDTGTSEMALEPTVVVQEREGGINIGVMIMMMA